MAVLHEWVVVFCLGTTSTVLVDIVLSSSTGVVLVMPICFGICASAGMLAAKVTLVFCDLFVLDVYSSILYSSRPLERLSFIWVRSVLSRSSVRVIEVVKVTTRCWFARVTWTLCKHVRLRIYCTIDA